MSWRAARLGEITEKIGSGVTPRGGSSAYKSDGVPLIRSMNVIDGGFKEDGIVYIDDTQAAQMSNVTLIEGDVLLNITGASVARACLLPKKYSGGRVNQHVLIIRPDKRRILPGFLAHYLSAPATKATLLRLANSGATREAITKAQVEVFEVPVPPLCEQRRIAAILDQASALRRKRAEASKLFHSLPEAIFDDLFGDVVKNNKGWPLKSVGEFVRGFQSGRNLVADDQEDSNAKFRVLKVSAVTSLMFRPEQSKALPPNYTPPPNHMVRNGDLLFSRANTSELIGATAFVEENVSNIVLPDKLWRFVWSDPADVEPFFVWFLFRQPTFREEIRKRASGTSGSMKNIAQAKVLQIRVGLPPKALQNDFSRKFSKIRKLQKTSDEQAAHFDALFVSLQHRAFRGEL
jgi:type I restriction enzyme S subunit